jgi:hypothetical protein
VLRTDAWRSENRVLDVPAIVAPGETWELAIPIVAPVEPGEYEEAFDLVAENATWMDAPVRHRVRVDLVAEDAGVPDVDASVVDASTSSEDAGARDAGARDAGRDERARATGGCAASGRANGLALVGLMIVVGARRRGRVRRTG